MSDLLDGTGHPARFGYVKCSRCGTMRPIAALAYVIIEGSICLDQQWCDKQASKATGLDAHGDAT